MTSFLDGKRCKVDVHGVDTHAVVVGAPFVPRDAAYSFVMVNVMLETGKLTSVSMKAVTMLFSDVGNLIKA